MNTQCEYDVALSFAGEDRKYVEQVAHTLRVNNIRVFYDGFEDVNLWGKNLYTHLSSIYSEKANYTIIFISKYYASKLWTNHEKENAQARAFRENREYILPARFDNTQIPGILDTIGYIDLTTLSPEKFALLICKKVTQGFDIEANQNTEFNSTKYQLQEFRSRLLEANDPSKLRHLLFDIVEFKKSHDPDYDIEELIRKIEEAIRYHSRVAKTNMVPPPPLPSHLVSHRKNVVLLFWVGLAMVAFPFLFYHFYSKKDSNIVPPTNINSGTKIDTATVNSQKAATNENSNQPNNIKGESTIKQIIYKEQGHGSDYIDFYFQDTSIWEFTGKIEGQDIYGKAKNNGSVLEIISGNAIGKFSHYEQNKLRGEFKVGSREIPFTDFIKDNESIVSDVNSCKSLNDIRYAEETFGNDYMRFSEQKENTFSFNGKISGEQIFGKVILNNGELKIISGNCTGKMKLYKYCNYLQGDVKAKSWPFPLVFVDYRR